MKHMKNAIVAHAAQSGSWQINAVIFNWKGLNWHWKNADHERDNLDRKLKIVYSLKYSFCMISRSSSRLYSAHKRPPRMHNNGTLPILCYSFFLSSRQHKPDMMISLLSLVILTIVARFQKDQKSRYLDLFDRESTLDGLNIGALYVLVIIEQVQNKCSGCSTSVAQPALLCGKILSDSRVLEIWLSRDISDLI